MRATGARKPWPTRSGEPFRVYLAPGVHTLRMEVVLGDMAQIIGRVQSCVQQLNAIYRKVIYITGVKPDRFRDYQIEASLPLLKADLTAVKDELSARLLRAAWKRRGRTPTSSRCCARCSISWTS